MSTKTVDISGSLAYDAQGDVRQAVPLAQSIDFTFEDAGIFPVPAETSPGTGWQLSPDAMVLVRVARIVNRTGREIAYALNDGDQISLADGDTFTYTCSDPENVCCPVTYVYVYLAWQEQLVDGEIEYFFAGDPDT